MQVGNRKASTNVNLQYVLTSVSPKRNSDELSFQMPHFFSLNTTFLPVEQNNFSCGILTIPLERSWHGRRETTITAAILKKVNGQPNHPDISCSSSLPHPRSRLLYESQWRWMGLPVPEQYRMQSTIQLVIKADVITLQTSPLGEASQC